MVDETGKQLGIMGLFQAIQLAKERNLDLVQVTEKVEPPICRIADYGKYLYSLQKKERKIKQIGGELKVIRIGFNISPHDLETKVKMAERFLKKGDKVKIEMRLRGREKALQNFAREKISQFLKLIETMTPVKIERELKKDPRGLTMIISKK